MISNELLRNQIEEALMVLGEEVSLADVALVLENHSPKEVREYLETSGIINDLPQLRTITEETLSLRGGEEFSNVIAALEPSEIGKMINVSPEVFVGDALFLIHPDDIVDPNKWEPISDGEYKNIIASGDKSKIKRLRNLGEKPWLKKGCNWAIFKDEIAIYPETIMGYLSAIKNAENRNNEWKENTVNEIGYALVAYCSRQCPEILDVLRDISYELMKKIEELRLVPNLFTKATEEYFEVQKRIEESVLGKGKSIIVTGNEDLQSVVNGLRSIGVNMTAEEIIENRAIEDALKSL